MIIALIKLTLLVMLSPCCHIGLLSVGLTVIEFHVVYLNIFIP